MSLPAAIQPLLTAYRDGLERDLPGFASACYLHGSLALDAFDPSQSDIDFLTVINRPATAADLTALAALHARLKADYPKPPLSGSYLQRRDLGQPNAVVSPVFDEGKLNPTCQHDFNPITWWLLKHGALTLFEPDASTLDVAIEWPTVAAWIRGNMTSYWGKFTREPARMAWLLSDWGVAWVVLGVLRQVYSLREQGITSKVGAGEYGLKTVPPRWTRIVQEALNMRQGRGPSLYRFKLLRAFDAYQFLRWVVGEVSDKL